MAELSLVPDCQPITTTIKAIRALCTVRFEEAILPCFLDDLACSLPSVGDRSSIILGVPRSNHKERGKFKDNVIKKTIWVKNKSTFAW